jgi:rare lipoprotein A
MSTRTFVTISAALMSLALGLQAHAQQSAPAKAEPAPAAVAPAPAPAAAAAAPASSGSAMEGLAAYYSNRLNGRKTASGEVFDQGKLTAAHQTLPYGTKVKVTNTKNNRSVVVRINDRGPTQAGRVIDLSRAAASKLGMMKSGLVPVKLEVVAEAPAKKSAKKK